VVLWLHVSAFFGHPQGAIQQRNILPMHIYDINRHYCILLCSIHPWE